MSPHRSAEDPDGAAMPPLPFCAFPRFVASGWRGWEPLALRARLWSGAALAASRAVPALGGCSLGPGWRSPVPGGCLAGMMIPRALSPSSPRRSRCLSVSPRGSAAAAARSAGSALLALRAVTMALCPAVAASPSAASPYLLRKCLL